MKNTDPSVPGDDALSVKERAVDFDQSIAEALNDVPKISKKVRAIGWSLVIEQQASPFFFEDLLAIASANSHDVAERMLTSFAALLDAHFEDIVGMDECLLQAWVVDEQMDEPVRHLNVH